MAAKRGKGAQTQDHAAPASPMPVEIEEIRVLRKSGPNAAAIRRRMRLHRGKSVEGPSAKSENARPQPMTQAEFKQAKRKGSLPPAVIARVEEASKPDSPSAKHRASTNKRPRKPLRDS